MGFQPEAVMFDLGWDRSVLRLPTFYGMQMRPEGDRVPAGGGRV